MRALVSLVWVFVSLAFAFDALAEPCDLRQQFGSPGGHEMMSDMPCDDGMNMGPVTDPVPEAPDEHDDACCCAVLLSSVVINHPALFQQPLPGLTIWSAVVPVALHSAPFEYEPPPPRI